MYSMLTEKTDDCRRNNKTLHNNDIVLRILCALHRNDAQKLSCITFFLDTQAVLTLKGPFGRVL